MAISFTRLLCQKQLGFQHARGILMTKAPAVSCAVSRCFADVAQVSETFSERNQRLKRPMSPHLTIYKPQLTTMLSITHRGTGIALVYYATGAALTELFMPGGMSCLIQSVDAMCLPIPVLFLGKFLVAWPATYHYFNGIRHLAWDLGQFLTIKDVYKTGWTVVGLSVISAILLAAVF